MRETLSAVIVCWSSAFAVRGLLRSAGVVDRPNQRSSHTEPTVRGGGIAIVCSVWALGIVQQWHHYSPAMVTILSCFACLAIISFVDDLKGLGSLTRFGCHLVAAIAAVEVIGVDGLLSSFFPFSSSHIVHFVEWSLSILWIVGYTNAFNFMDGINGIASTQAAIGGLGGALLYRTQAGLVASDPVILSYIVGGAALGFLPHNFPRARMFMGDVGSAPLGYLLAVIVLWAAKVAGWWTLIPFLLLHSNFVLDTAITLGRRVVRRERWYEAHREHFYQRLVRSGKSHTFVTGMEVALQVVVLSLLAVYLSASTPLRLAIISSILVLWLCFFYYCERVYRRFSEVG